MADFDDVKTKIRKLIEEQYSPSSSDLKDIIEYLSLYMKREEKSRAEGGIAHEPIYNSDFHEDEGTSTFERVNWRADLDAGEDALNFDTLLGAGGASGTAGPFAEDGIWNESVKALIQKYRDYFFKISEDVGITVSGTDKNGQTVSRNFYIVRNILKANAGNHFKKIGSNWWTLPFWNIDGDSYNTVRGTDQIEQVLTSSKNMDFTHTQEQADVESLTNDESPVKKYIRLLMPRYTRRVEVEDLNRNFWVIGQVLSIVCADLFDKDGPISQMFKSLASETLQLWENVLYLWAAIELLNEKKGEAPEPSYGIHYEVIDMPRAYDKPYRDINAFVTVPKFEGNANWYYPFRAYAHAYPNNCLCLLVRCRFGNYEKDYYHTEVYPYIVYYNRYNNEWKYSTLKVNGSTNYKYFGFTLRIDSETTNEKLYNYLNLRQYFYGVREDAPNNYYHYFPFEAMPPKNGYVDPSGTSKYGPQDAMGQHYYYAMASIAPTIYAKVENKKIYVTTLKFEIQDIARRMHYLGLDQASDPDHPEHDDHPSIDQFVDDGRDAIEYYKYEVVYINGDNTNSTSEDTININITNPLGSIIKPQYIYNGTTYNIPQGFQNLNERDSGFQHSLCDMITYRGTSKS